MAINYNRCKKFAKTKTFVKWQINIIIINDRNLKKFHSAGGMPVGG